MSDRIEEIKDKYKAYILYPGTNDSKIVSAKSKKEAGELFGLNYYYTNLWVRELHDHLPSEVEYKNIALKNPRLVIKTGD